MLAGTAVAWVDSFPIGIKNCPVCSSPSIRKVSEIFRNTGHFDVDSSLAKQMAPPKRPGDSGRILVLLPLGVSLGSAIVAFVATVAASAHYLAPVKGDSLPSWAVAICFSLPLVVFAGVWLLSRRVVMKRRAVLNDENRADLDRWAGEMEVWERLYYCNSCGKVSDPLVGRSAHVHAMSNLLDK